MNEFMDVLSILGHIVRALGFIVLGFGIGRFTMDAYKKAVWQVQIALALGFFGLLVGLTNYASAGSKKYLSRLCRMQRNKNAVASSYIPETKRFGFHAKPFLF